MKRKIFVWMLTALCVSLVLFGCSNKCKDGHTDGDRNAKCDVCGAAIPCATHADADGNLVCDLCGAAVTPVCELHSDGDGDLLCDLCGAAVTASCNPHKDTNADGLCDDCGGAIVVINQQIAPKGENRVEMAVNPIPTNVALGEYLVNVPNRQGILNADKVAYTNLFAGRHIYSRTESADGTSYVYSIKNALSGVEVPFLTKPMDVAVDVNDYQDVFLASFPAADGKREYIYYSYAGEVLYSQVAYADQAPVLNTAEPIRNGLSKVIIEDQVFVIDPVTDQVIAKNLDPKTFVDLPALDEMNERYGYVLLDHTLYAYDLSKWIECVLAYDLPSYYENPQWFLLGNGNLLVQAMVRLEDNAVSYDCLEDGRKYDLVYVLMNPSEKKVETIEFGYYVEKIIQAKDEPMLTEKALNLAIVYPIVNDRIDYHAPKELVVDHGMKVLYDCAQTLKVSGGIGSLRAVASNLFLAEIQYGESEIVYEVLNEKGEHVVYLPDSALKGYQYVKYDGKYYNYKMDQLLDPVSEGYEIRFETEEYLILAKETAEGTVDFYFFNGSSAPVRLDLKGGSLDALRAEGYVIKTVTNEKTVYSFFNFNAEFVVDLVAPLTEIRVIDGEEGVWLIYDENGNAYLAK